MKLNIGAGQMPIEGYLSVDSQPITPDTVVARIPHDVPWEPGTIEHIYAGHVIEHIPPWDVLPFLACCYDLLQPNGTLTLVTPDSRKIRLMGMSGLMHSKGVALTLCGDTGGDMDHRILWREEWLGEALLKAGFSIDDAYSWKEDTRVYDRAATWQCGLRGIK